MSFLQIGHKELFFSHRSIHSSWYECIQSRYLTVSSSVYSYMHMVHLLSCPSICLNLEVGNYLVYSSLNPPLAFFNNTSMMLLPPIRLSSVNLLMRGISIFWKLLSSSLRGTFWAMKCSNRLIRGLSTDSMLGLYKCMNSFFLSQISRCSPIRI